MHQLDKIKRLDYIKMHGTTVGEKKNISGIEFFPSSNKRVRRHLLIGFSIGHSTVVVSARHLPKMGTNPVPRTWGFNLHFKHGMMKKADTVNDS